MPAGPPPGNFGPGQIVTVFRSRLRPEHEADYHEEADRIAALAATMPGLVDVKGFTAPDGERVTLVTFADRAAHDGWRYHLDHMAAQRQGRSRFYAEYSIQVCSTERASRFAAGHPGENT